MCSLSHCTVAYADRLLVLGRGPVSLAVRDETDLHRFAGGRSVWTSNAALDTADDELESADSDAPPLLLHDAAVNANKATSAGNTATRTSLIPVAPVSRQPAIVVELLRICPPSPLMS